jgi:hypothetical protein
MSQPKKKKASSSVTPQRLLRNDLMIRRQPEPFGPAGLTVVQREIYENLQLVSKLLVAQQKKTTTTTTTRIKVATTAAAASSATSTSPVHLPAASGTHDDDLAVAAVAAAEKALPYSSIFVVLIATQCFISAVITDPDLLSAAHWAATNAFLCTSLSRYLRDQQQPQDQPPSSS